MQVIKEFKAITKFPVVATFIFVIIFGYVDYFTVVAISQIPALMNEIYTADLTMLVLADIGIAIIILFAGIVVVWFNAIMIRGFIRHIRLIGVSVGLLDEGVRIKGRSKGAFIPNSSIIHISRSGSRRYLFIVWNGRTGIKSFVLSSRTFGMAAVEEADLILRERKGYIADSKQALAMRKSMKKFRGILWPKGHCDIADGVGA
ncbi:MAG: hypothetical protein ACYST6_13020 [Planctomycetota bacterium]|jgi:hypothetical protein